MNNAPIINVSGEDYLVKDQVAQDNISLLKNKLYFANNCPFIKELYVTPEGYSRGVRSIHFIDGATSHRIAFTNAAMDTFTGIASYSSPSKYYDIAEIVQYGGSTVLGYILIDWRLITSDVAVQQPLNSISYDIDFSPSIKTELQSGSDIASRVSALETEAETLSTSISDEQEARVAADNLLGTRIDNLVAPTGESVAELVDARVGADGTVYASLEARLNAEYDGFNDKLNKVRTVGSGQQYATIAEAVGASSPGDVVIVFPGTYHEYVRAINTNIAIIGTNRDECILENENGNYARPPLELGKGILKNMTLHAIAQELQPGAMDKAYAMHCDFQGSGLIGGYTYCENVKFINDDHRTVGIGTRGYGHIEFVNCEFVAYSSSALYCHDANDLAYDILDQSISFINCSFVNDCDTIPTIEFYSQEVQSKAAEVTWCGNVVCNKGTGGLITMGIYQSRPIIDGNGWLGCSDWVLTKSSGNNSINSMNNVGIRHEIVNVAVDTAVADLAPFTYRGQMTFTKGEIVSVTPIYPNQLFVILPSVSSDRKSLALFANGSGTIKCVVAYE